ncbi:hypothetical protein LTR09_009595 [Extremus antarcticus]|uniref:Uncharacterized protein n=1 Tax=Extremus antarcticus TaxID=702011 RepID=A0AAJ0DFK8_9PEZI|nr:hypothetical protein LTR09_009595 [Extremus antarcticus]
MCTNTWHNYACSCEYFAGVQPCLAAGMRCPGGRECKTKKDVAVEYGGACRRCGGEWSGKRRMKRDAVLASGVVGDGGPVAAGGPVASLGPGARLDLEATPGSEVTPGAAVATAGPANASGAVQAAVAAPVAPVSTIAVNGGDEDEVSDDDSDGGVVLTPSSGHSRSPSTVEVEDESMEEDEGLGGDFVLL